MNSLDIYIKRQYTKELESNKELSVYDLFNWKKVDVFIENYETGEVLFDKKDLEFPEHFSQNACNIIASKFFRLAGVPNSFGYENSYKQVVHRMCYFWASNAVKEGIILKDKEKILYDEYAYMLINQVFAPNSPQWFNTGLHQQYNIDKKGEGYFYYDEKSKEVKESELAYEKTAGSACFILSVEDSLLGDKSISDILSTETKLFKYGAGTGSNFSNIRAKYEKLGGGGTSSGLLSFLKVFDSNAGAVKSGGTTRRAAKIDSLNADHPEIEAFIEWKAKEEKKVADLVKMGYSPDFNGEAYATVSGQNSNNSIRISNILMDKMLGVDKNPDWLLKGRKDTTVNKIISAVDLWDKWNRSSWFCGDPAPQFDDIINAWHTCPAGLDGLLWHPHNRINASNPCSEYHFLDDTACNLLSVNFVKFYDIETGIFDISKYIYSIMILQIILEVTIYEGHYPTKEVALKSYMFRTTGLGPANTATLNMLMGHPYDSDIARNVTASLVGLMTSCCYLSSSLMAEQVGPFEAYDINKEHMLKVLRNHSRVAGALTTPYEDLGYIPVKIDHELLKNEGYEYIGVELVNTWLKVLKYGNKYGFRNAQTTVVAPTGTISFAMDCSTTSVEPFFGHIVSKKLAGGGYISIVNPIIGSVLRRLKYKESQIQSILDYIIENKKIEGSPYLLDEHLPIFDTANKSKGGTRYISPEGHIKMVASITPLISGAVSKTVNTPSTATIEDFKRIHSLSYKLGVKAIALYRDGSKVCQPLNIETQDLEKTLEDLPYTELLSVAKKSINESLKIQRNRPYGIRSAKVHEARIDDLKIYITVSFGNNGTITEIYATSDREGTLVKGLLDSVSKIISKMLQYNVPAKDIAKTLRGQKYEPHGFVSGHPYIKSVDSISDFISKVIEIELGDYSHCQVKPDNIELEEKNKMQDFSHPEESDKKIKKIKKIYGKICPYCSGSNLVKNGTCYVCTDCGSTTGCS